jgi:organic radical activating enzyme
MRDPNRIPEVLAEIERLWRMVPDWRLGQLIVNVAGGDPFNVEDDRLIELVKTLAEYPYTNSPAPAGEESEER